MVAWRSPRCAASHRPDSGYCSVLVGIPNAVADIAGWPSSTSSPASPSRGGLTVHALRVTVGDDAFWRIVRSWAARNRFGTGSTPEFIALAEQISGQQLDALFDAWLFQPGKPAHPGTMYA